MPAMLMEHLKDPKDVVLEKVGDISGITVMNSLVLLGHYERPTRTASGLHLPDSTKEEEQYQGTAYVVLKKGPLAFQDTDQIKFHSQNVEVGDWVMAKTSDGMQMKVNKHPCRLISDTLIRMKIDNPDRIW
jgi:co-chaperonin GroES (HSP10)